MTDIDLIGEATAGLRPGQAAGLEASRPSAPGFNVSRETSRYTPEQKERRREMAKLRRHRDEGKRKPKRDRQTEQYWRERIARESGIVPDVPGADEVPASLRGAVSRDRAPRRTKVASGEEARELREQIVQALALANTAFLGVTPCTCAAQIPEPLRGAVHLDTCARMLALDDDELSKLAEALAAELEANPALGARVMERLGSWAPHIALLMCIVAISGARLNRKGVAMIVRELTPEQQGAVVAWRAPQPSPNGSNEPQPVYRTEASPWRDEPAEAPPGEETVNLQ